MNVNRTARANILRDGVMPSSGSSPTSFSVQSLFASYSAVRAALAFGGALVGVGACSSATPAPPAALVDPTGTWSETVNGVFCCTVYYVGDAIPASYGIAKESTVTANWTNKNDVLTTTWGTGEVDTLTLSSDGDSFSGTSNAGAKIAGIRTSSVVPLSAGTGSAIVVGQACSPGAEAAGSIACDQEHPQNALVCTNGTYQLGFTCPGTETCGNTAGYSSVTCGTGSAVIYFAVSGNACATEGSSSCTTDKSLVLTCTNGTWTPAIDCSPSVCEYSIAKNDIECANGGYAVGDSCTGNGYTCSTDQTAIVQCSGDRVVLQQQCAGSQRCGMKSVGGSTGYACQ